MNEAPETIENPEARDTQAVYDGLAPLKLLASLAAIQAELAESGIAKTRQNAQQHFAYRGIDDVMNALAPLFAKHNVIALPRYGNIDRRENVSKSGSTLFYVTLTCDMEFLSTLDGGSLTASAYGEAFDSGDKATGKAQSVAYREVLVKTFCIPVNGADADIDATTPPESVPIGESTAETVAAYRKSVATSHRENAMEAQRGPAKAPPVRQYPLNPAKVYPKPESGLKSPPTRADWLIEQVQPWPKTATTVFRALHLIEPDAQFDTVTPEALSAYKPDDFKALIAEVREQAALSASKAAAGDQIPGAEVPEDAGVSDGVGSNEAPASNSIVEAVSEQSGKSARGPWVRYGIKIGNGDGNGEWYSTFDRKLGETAKALKGKSVMFEFNETQRGNDLVSIAEWD